MTHGIHPEAEEYLRSFCEPVLPGRGEVLSHAECRALAADAEGLMVCMADRVDDEFLLGCPRLRIVSAVLKGYDNLDAAACARRGVWLTILPDLLTAPTAELAVGLAIGLGRRLLEADRLVRGGNFHGWRPRLYGTGLSGSTAGILGMGELGQAVARRLAAFGARILYHDLRQLPAAQEAESGAARAPLGEVLERSDFVWALLPLTDRTRGLLGADALRRMRADALLINVGRGSVVDEQAVCAALEQGLLGGYAADVFAMEDLLLPGHPDRVPPALLSHPRTLWTPHLGSAVDGVRRAMTLAAVAQLERGLRRERPDHEITAGVGLPRGAVPPQRSRG